MATKAGTGQSQHPIRFLGQLSLVARYGLLALAVALAFALTGLFFQARHGSPGLISAGTAALICLLAGFLGLLITEFLPVSGASAAFVRMSAGMMVRMALPLGCFLLLYVQKSSLLESGLAESLIFIYLVMLAVETLILCGRPARGIAPRSAGKGSVDG